MHHRLAMAICAGRRCKRPTASCRSRFCAGCVLVRKAAGGMACSSALKQNAGKAGGVACSGALKESAGSMSSGNSTCGALKQNAGKAGGVACSGALKQNAGASGGVACKGAKKRRAGEMSRGNSAQGLEKQRAGSHGGLAGAANDKKAAGRRSGKRRCAKDALVVKKRWLDKIFSKEKTWEIRGCRTEKRGWIHFAESQAGGKLVGRALLKDCVQIPRQEFAKHFERHRVANMKEVNYKFIFAWVLGRAQRFKKPFVYKHKQGAVIWASV